MMMMLNQSSKTRAFHFVGLCVCVCVRYGICRRRPSSANQSTVIGIYRPSSDTHKNIHKIRARMGQEKGKILVNRFEWPLGTSCNIETRQWCGRKTKEERWKKENSKILISFCMGFRFGQSDSDTACKSISNSVLFIVQLLINKHRHRR